MSEKVPTTNDAARLEQILLKAANTKIMSNENILMGWGKVFDIAQPDNESALPRITSRIAELRRLNQSVLLQLDEIEGINASLFSQPLQQLERALQPQTWTSTQWQIIQSVLSPVNFKSIEFIVDAFSKVPHLQEKIIPADELQSIAGQINELYEQVSKSKLKKTLKDALLEMLNQMMQGIHEYNIGGVRRLKQHLANTYSVWLSYQDEIKPEEKKDNIVMTILSLATRLVTVSEVVSKTAGLLGPAIKGLIGSGDGS